MCDWFVGYWGVRFGVTKKIFESRIPTDVGSPERIICREHGRLAFLARRFLSWCAMIGLRHRRQMVGVANGSK